MQWGKQFKDLWAEGKQEATFREKFTVGRKTLNEETKQ